MHLQLILAAVKSWSSLVMWHFVEDNANTGKGGGGPSLCSPNDEYRSKDIDWLRDWLTDWLIHRSCPSNHVTNPTNKPYVEGNGSLSRINITSLIASRNYSRNRCRHIGDILLQSEFSQHLLFRLSNLIIYPMYLSSVSCSCPMHKQDSHFVTHPPTHPPTPTTHTHTDWYIDNKYKI